MFFCPVATVISLKAAAMVPRPRVAGRGICPISRFA